MNANQARRRRTTEVIELVETHNIVKSINRMTKATPYDGNRWRRALYHAIMMSEGSGRVVGEKIRIALELP